MTSMTISVSGGTHSYGVHNTLSSPTMTGMTVAASGSTNNFGVYLVESSPNMTNLTITASGGNLNYAVSGGGSPIMNNVTASASGGDSVGVKFYEGTTRIDNSIITGGTNTILASGGPAVKVGASRLAGVPVSGSVTCAGVYDENYVFYPSTCP
jgi:hypothetical protein